MLDPIHAGINYSPLFREYEACIAAGESIWAWEQGEYPNWFRANIIAWYEGHNLIKSHSEDAVARKMRKKRKK